eukprot:m.2052 g.2052  ORF g.2052 m.2052 type:complete len:228 (+) comp8219_c0_seq1:49-732(+)
MLLESSSVYSSLPGCVLNDSDTLGLRALEQTPKQFVESFVDSHVKCDKEKVQHNLKHKRVLLDPLKAPKRLVKAKKASGPFRSISSKEKKRRKMHDIEQEVQNYDDFIPLHELWLQYMNDLLKITDSKKGPELLPKLFKADYHGCKITVSKSKCPSYIGLTGIIVMETQNTFKIITQENNIKVIPKSGSVFSFRIRSFLFHLYGSQICCRTADRSAKRFKSKSTTGL